MAIRILSYPPRDSGRIVRVRVFLRTDPVPGIAEPDTPKPAKRWYCRGKRRGVGVFASGRLRGRAGRRHSGRGP